MYNLSCHSNVQFQKRMCNYDYEMIQMRMNPIFNDSL